MPCAKRGLGPTNSVAGKAVALMLRWRANVAWASPPGEELLGTESLQRDLRSAGKGPSSLKRAGWIE